MKLPEIHLHFHEGVMEEDLRKLETQLKGDFMAFKDDVQAKIDAEKQQVLDAVKKAVADALAGKDVISEQDKADILSSIDSISDSIAAQPGGANP